MASAHASVVIILIICLGSGCGLVRRIKGDSFGPRADRQGAESPEEDLLTTIKSEDGLAVSATVSASSTKAQKINASERSNLSGSSVIFPPGSLAVDTTVTMEDGVDLAADGVLAELGVKDATSVSEALVATSSPEIDPVQPFTVFIASTSGATLLQDISQLFVVYKVKRVGEDKIFAGIIPTSKISVSTAGVRFSVNHFGSFQIFSSLQPPAESSIESKNKISTKRGTVTTVKTESASGPEGQSSTADGGDDDANGTSNDGSGDDAGLPIAIKFLSSDIVNGSTGVVLTNPMVNLRFDQPIDPASIASSCTVKQISSNTPVAKTTSLSVDGQEIRLTIAGRLKPFTDYEIAIGTGLRGTNGSALGAAETITFKTKDISPETVFAADAGSGTIGDDELLMASNSSGQAVVVWANPVNVMAALNPGNGWLSPSTIYNSGNVTNLRVSMDGTGRACAAWIDTEVYSNCYDPNTGSWAGPTMHNEGSGTASGISLVSNETYTVLIWIEGDGGDPTFFHDTLTGASNPGTIFIGNAPVFNPSRGAFLANDGKMVIAFHNTPTTVVTSYWDGSAWVWDQFASSGGVGQAPQVGIDSSGMAFAVWGENVSGYKMYGTRFDSVWLTPVQIANPARFFSATQVSGRVVYTDSANAVGEVTRSAGAGFNASGLMVTGTGTVDNDVMGVFSNSRGDTTAFWYQFDPGVGAYRPDYGIARSDAPNTWLVGHLTPQGCDYYAPNVMVLDSDGNGAFTCRNYDGVNSRNYSLFTRMVSGGVFGTATDTRVALGLNETTDVAKSVLSMAMVNGAENRIHTAFVILDGSTYEIKILTHE